MKLTDSYSIQISEPLRDYPGGVHPLPNKSISAGLPIHAAWLPERLAIPLSRAGALKVEIGDRVLKGEPLTYCSDPMQVMAHAPTSGMVEAIVEQSANHPSGLNEPMLILKSDGNDQWREQAPLQNPEQLDNQQLLAMIQQAGITGLGGAGFPTQVKLKPNRPVNLLIINGAECEPYITADDTLMQAHGEQVILGSKLMAKLLGQPKVIIAIESDKPKAVKALNKALSTEPEIELKVIPTKYPSGGEKQLIQILTGQEVPSGGLPLDLGVVVQNVGTAYAVKRAVYDDEPLIQRVVTLTGDQVQKPGNHWVLIGTPVSALLENHQVNAKERVIVGGSMMGYELPDLEAPVNKTTNCLIIPSRHELPKPQDAMPCIRCGACAEACPASLLPQQLHWYALAQDEAKLTEHNLFDCIECGACAYVCPSSIPLVLEYRQAKAQIRQTQQEHLKAEKAKQRFEARQTRLEQEKQARENRHKQAAQARIQAANKASSSDGEKDSKAAMIAAALARAKAKKRAEAPKAVMDEKGQPQPDNSDVIAQREARKAKARAHKEVQTNETVPTVGDEQKARVAAAVARAKAKRAQTNEAAPTSDDAKKAKIAAAVAKAKAKQTQADDIVPSADDEKKAKIAAAIAKAKAKQAQKSNQESE